MRMLEHARRAVGQASSPTTCHGARARTAPALRVGNQAQQRLLLQTKLSVNPPGDRFEQEADRVAETVIRMAEPPAATTAMIGAGPDRGPRPRIQRMCSTCEDETTAVQRKEASGAPPLVIPQSPSELHSALGGGQPLAGASRAFMESRLGHDFGDVRIHSDARAAESARRLQARAFTMGRDVVFAAGQFSPHTTDGRRLLAHELTHVVQQGTAGEGNAPPHLQRLGDPKEAPKGMRCPIATTSATEPVVADVLFSLGSARLTPTAITDLASIVARWTAAGSNRDVRVDGFASTDGPQSLNWPLSCDRALAVAAELENPSSGVPGIPSQFIEFLANGESTHFGATLESNRRATVTADLAVQPSCANPGDARTLDLQPVFLRTSAADPSPTGVSWTRRFNETNAIWGKVGVTFVELTPITVDTPLKATGGTNAEVAAVAALRRGAGVEIFVVDNDMVSSGGASTLGPLAALCNTGKIVMSDRGASDTLLAHELGHVLGIQHPGTPPNPGDPGTIMVGSGSNAVANSRRNTLANFNRILCPPPTASTCLNPDP